MPSWATVEPLIADFDLDPDARRALQLLFACSPRAACKVVQSMCAAGRALRNASAFCMRACKRNEAFWD
jgi:hypothetical protein